MSNYGLTLLNKLFRLFKPYFTLVKQINEMTHHYHFRTERITKGYFTFTFRIKGKKASTDCFCQRLWFCSGKNVASQAHRTSLVKWSGNTANGRGSALVTPLTAEGPLPARREWFREHETLHFSLEKMFHFP